MTDLPERMVEAAARAYREAVDSLNGATDEQIAEAVIRRALAVAEADGVVLCQEILRYDVLEKKLF
jgi:hypothetical protein